MQTYPGLEALKATFRHVKTEGDKVFGMTACGKCGGSGRHWAGGCWSCRSTGNGKWLRIDEAGWNARMQAANKRELKREEERLARIRKNETTLAANHAALGIDVAATLAAQPNNVALASILGCTRPLTEKQIAAVHKMIAQHAERAVKAEAAKLVKVEDGRQTIIGTVQSIKGKDTPYGFVVKMLIEREDGVRFYGTVPAAIDNVMREDVVQFDAKVECKEPGFGFFSRPTKAIIVTRCEEGQQIDAEKEAELQRRLEIGRKACQHAYNTIDLV